jgi:hypothetical protein
MNPGVNTDTSVSQAVEQRGPYRAEIQWPVWLSRGDRDIPVHALTKNVSSFGFYCYSPVSFVPGEILKCSIELPTWCPGEPDELLILECRAEVNWVDAVEARLLFGVECQIRDYSVIKVSDNRRGRYAR